MQFVDVLETLIASYSSEEGEDFYVLISDSLAKLGQWTVEDVVRSHLPSAQHIQEFDLI